MKILLRLMIVFMLIIVAAPAYSAEVMQMWRCELADEATEAEVKSMAQDWLNAAKKMPGGEGFNAFVNFPVAVNAPGEIDILFVVTAPSFEAWGKFWDNYLSSPAAEVDKKYQDKITCPGSALWEVERVK